MEDHVDGVVTAWGNAHPDWDLTGMAVLGRVSRIERLLEVRRLEALRPDGLTTADIDVLASLWHHPAGQRPRDGEETDHDRPSDAMRPSRGGTGMRMRRH